MQLKATGEQRLGIVSLLLLVGVMSILALAIVKAGILGASALLALPLAVLFFAGIMARPRYGIIAVIVVGFLANGISRYVSGPVGLSIDILLGLTALASIFLKDRTRFRLAGNSLTWMTVAWFGYTFLELLNPLSVSREAWFYAVRGVSLYHLFLVPLTFMLFATRRDLNIFLKIWLVFSVAAAIWGIRQVYLGIDAAEQQWLDEGGSITHIINGRLRAFSFYSDAGQFGAAMAHAGLAFLIIGLTPGMGIRRWACFAVALLCFFGLVISGTRGALFIPLVGFMAFLLLVKNFRVFTVGIGAIFMMVAFLKFTTIGQGDYNIRRMRSALNPNDPSLVVRKENQRKIGEYLANKPFGAGIGSGGSWAVRFAPDSFLATTPLDSWYVKIWAETGIVGLTLHLLFILFVAVRSFLPVYRCPEPFLKYKLAALYCGFLGIAFASYGNQIYGQSPTSIIIAVSMVYLFSSQKLLSETGPGKPNILKRLVRKPQWRAKDENIAGSLTA
jgi:O-antigen ligase